MQRRSSILCFSPLLAACVLPGYSITDEGVAGQGGSTSSSSSGGGGTAGAGGSAAAGGAGGSGGGSGGAVACPTIGRAEALACDQAKPVAVAVDNTAFYWVNEGDGTVMTAPKLGGPAQVIASGQGQPCGIVVRNGFVYWRTREGAVRRKMVPDGAQENLAVGQGDSCAVDADASAAFWFSDDTGNFAVMMASPPGNSPVKIASALTPGDLDAQAGGEVGWTDPGAGKAYTSPKTPGDSASQIATGGVLGIAFHGPDFYLSDASGGSISIGQTGLAQQGFASGLSMPTGIVVWNNEILWIEEGADRVARKDIGSPVADPPISLIEGVPACGAIAADAVHVYFATCDDGRIFRVSHAVAVIVQ